MKRLIKKASLELMHGTTDKFIDEIRKKGIVCPADSDNMATGPASGGYMGVTDPYAVYVTNQDYIAEYYARRAAQAFGGNPIIVYVSLNDDDLFADEDFYNNCISVDGGYQITSPTNGDYLELTDEEYDNFSGKDCLDFMGTAGTRNIPVSKIENIEEN